MCAELGWSNVATYIQSGNLVFDAPRHSRGVEAALEALIREHSAMTCRRSSAAARNGRNIPASIPSPRRRGRARPAAHAALQAAAQRRAPRRRIQARARAGEQVRQAGDALWIHYPEGAGTSKLTPALIDSAIGSPGTAATTHGLKLLEMLEG